MHRLVRDLYRRVLWVGREYPTGLTHVRLKAKEHFRANALVSSDEEINRCIARGRWFVNEMIGVIQLKKCEHLANSIAIDSLVPLNVSSVCCSS